MFDIGIGEVFVILVVALLVFGPDRLPTMAKQAASFVRDLRTMVANARRDLSDSVGDLGIDEDDLRTLSDLRNPRSFVRKKVLDGVDLGLDDLGLDDDTKPAKRTNGAARNGNKAATGTSSRTSSSGGTTSPTPDGDTAAPEADGPADTEDPAGAEGPAEDATPAGAHAAGPAPEPPRFDPDAT